MMRKFATLFILSITIILVTSCSSKTDSVGQENIDKTQVNEQAKVDATKDNVITETPTSSENNNYQYYAKPEQSDEEQNYSITIAISNAIVVNDGSRDRNVVYKHKCDSCGYVEPGTYSTVPGSRKGGFYCPKCEETKVVELKTEYYHE